MNVHASYTPLTRLLHASCFIRCTDVSCCSLYDKCYTVVGPQKSTVPNPRLLVKDTVVAAAPVRISHAYVDAGPLAAYGSFKALLRVLRTLLRLS